VDSGLLAVEHAPKLTQRCTDGRAQSEACALNSHYQDSSSYSSCFNFSCLFKADLGRYFFNFEDVLWQSLPVCVSNIAKVRNIVKID